MSKKKVFLTLTGYQITWLACVFGENQFNEPNLGIYIGSIFLLLYIYFNSKKINFIKISLLISIPGYLFDTLMVYFSIYEFNTSVIIGTVPIWMIILWLSFSTLFDEILIIFKTYKVTGIILSGLLGPLTYYFGYKIEVILINNIVLFFLLMTIFWIFIMVYYLEFILRKY